MMVRAGNHSAEPPLFIGTAGWSIPRSSDVSGGEGTHLQRYSRVFLCAEINSSFHRPHALTTYARWAAATPADFRFAVKLPKRITHEQQLRRSRSALQQFLEDSSGLGEKRGPLLLQLPPSFAFEARVVGRFLSLLRSLYQGPVVCEPRHATWGTASQRLLAEYEVARVAADPPPFAGADSPGGWAGLTYLRLHGSPDKYWSSYVRERLEDIGRALRTAQGERWCIFDNTAAGAALGNAAQLLEIVRAN